MPSYKTKIKVCGSKICVYEYSQTIPYGYSLDRFDFSKSRDGEKDEKNVSRTRQTLCDIVACNVSTYSKFLTFTFSETTLDKNEALKAWKYFIYQLKRKYGYKLNYVMIKERQKLRGLKEGNEGSWHFHAIVFNNEFLPFEHLKQVWGKFGSIDIKVVDQYYQLELYIAKYIQKDFVEGQKNDKLIYTSQGLKRPLISKTNDDVVIPKEKKTYEKSYALPLEISPLNLYTTCTYSEYQLAVDTSKIIEHNKK